MIVHDMKKLECPFVREMVDGNYIVVDEIMEGMEWVFEDDSVMAIEKLHGTNILILLQGGIVTGIWNRTQRVPFFNKGKMHIVRGVMNSFEKGYIDKLTDGLHFGELIGNKMMKNEYGLDDNLWIPFESFGQKHLRYKSWGKYPKDFKTISEWFKELMPLYNLMKCDRGMSQEEKMSQFVEGIVFTHPDGRMAKLRKDMFPWFKGRRH